jgi:uncharacterized membrane protein
VNEKTLRLASSGFAVIGVAITTYLLYVHWTGGTLACATSGCETVQHSRYAETFGLPVAALGLVAFAGLFVSAAVRGSRARLTQATLALTGLLFGAYLLYVQLVVIGALCHWCLASDLITIAITALAVLRLRIDTSPAPSAPTVQARQHPKPRPTGGSPSGSNPRTKSHKRTR